jgi:hypothetical protein
MSDRVLRPSLNTQITSRLYDGSLKTEGRKSGLLSICLSSRRHSINCEGVVSLKSAAVWVAALLVIGSIRFIMHLPLGATTAGSGGESAKDGPLLPKFDYYLD